MAAGDRGTKVIYGLAIKETKGKEVNFTPPTGASEVNPFWNDGTKVIGSDTNEANVKFWNYPVGDSPSKTMAGFSEPVGAAVSDGK